ncbi:unnamed protein product [Plutella xylostella]|uniref:(diamondback moth) hypothetical protein n=1 Tax=Plutella xylostella TaxID=51655 RepID=A0A8S4DID3_PLUXY|nr:unnamed protein product [Plutella xylostella]
MAIPDDEGTSYIFYKSGDVLCVMCVAVVFMWMCLSSMSKARENVKVKSNVNKFKELLILKMGFKSPSDALPFYDLDTTTVMKLAKCIEKDKATGFCENRLYYIAERIKCPPAILSPKLAKRDFIYTMSADWLENSLKVLLEMGVPGDRILRDLWVLKYHPTTIRERLQRVKDTGVKNLYPWMVRCSENILERSIQISKDAKSILGDSMSTQNYLANRLNITTETVEDMCVKLPALKTIRVTKLKSFLDFLIEEGFPVHEIADKPRVLTASQTTVKQRLEKLRKMGLQYINLNILCRSRKDFKKYCDIFESTIK